MTEPKHVRAQAHSSRHREEILQSEHCGCFYCLAIFSPSEITVWVDKEDDVGQTALCPRCGIEAVLGSKSGFPIRREFLAQMREHWFEMVPWDEVDRQIRERRHDNV